MLIPILLVMTENKVTFDDLEKNSKGPDYYFDLIYPCDYMHFNDNIYDLDSNWIRMLWNNSNKSKPFPIIPAPKDSKPRRPKKHQVTIDFLKKNNALIPYICNFKHSISAEKRKMTLTQMLKYMETSNDIFSGAAFNYSLTSEGYLYWKYFRSKCNLI